MGNKRAKKATTRTSRTQLSAAKPARAIVSLERIERCILLLRGDKVMLDADIAALYDVETRVLVQAVKRNLERFPADFMFQLSVEEFNDLRSQSEISSSWGGRRYPPFAFTEQGVAMLSSVLRSGRAVQVNIHQADFITLFCESQGEIDRDRALTYPALPAHHQNLVLDFTQR